MAEEVQIRYVEVPQVEWREVIVPKKEVVELTRRIPKVEIVEIEKIVEVPEIHEVAREVEVVHTEDIIRHVPRKEIINVPVEVVRHVPRPETVFREQVVNVPGEIIEVPKPFVIENKVCIPQFHDKHVPTVVAQVARPMFRSLPSQQVDVVAKDCDPVLIKVVVPVIKPVRTPVWEGPRTDTHTYVSVPPAEYNSLVHAVNRHMPLEYFQDLLVTSSAGVPIPPVADTPVIVPPIGTVTGVPPPPPQVPLIVQQRYAGGGFSSTTGVSPAGGAASPSPPVWTPPSALLYGPWSKEDERYYREHHYWFNPQVQHARTSPAKSRRSQASRHSRRSHG
eukprot:Gregarina_sp_Pseudo_9__5954@NODE_965_length_2025_cov_29_670695_g905_i0_p1_GENE_NODE_965_length_2025_cov_29_670695_g905_i0NODE_965_length_2025_cov_29_670695_g905_i0_p1_ORF_typecomplete_len353_score93_88IMCp/PF12314_8/0_004IMCp/PF12314_8/0_0001IMCp/PF12314_8/3_6e03_NODE_965_length_2025_cov_29_670695_g905_i09661970